MESRAGIPPAPCVPAKNMGLGILHGGAGGTPALLFAAPLRPKLTRRILSTGLLVVGLLLNGCSTFNRDWKSAAATTEPVDGIQGRWQGAWLSDVSGHTGRLRCLLTRDAAGRYQARFHAKYKKILSFGYTVPLTVEATNHAFRFHGEADLGWYAGGLYHYEGQVSPTVFLSNYRCLADHGTFQMTRPRPEE